MTFIVNKKTFDSFTLDFVRKALTEDIGSGDITTLATVDKKLKGEADIIAKESFVICAIDIAKEVFIETARTTKSKTTFKTFYKDGDFVKKGSVIVSIKGNLQSLLMGERVALNLMQRLSAISTTTDKFVRATNGKIQVFDTRKTTPCLRLFEKYAVYKGGGQNHRTGLYDRILIKENHIKAAGTIENAVERIRDIYGDQVFIECETQNLKEVRQALSLNVDMILLDNMTPTKVKQAVKVINSEASHDALIEISGGINLKNIKGYLNCGAHFISVGALTHSIKSVDISLLIK